MTTSRRLAPLPLLASLLRTPRRLTSSRLSPSGKSLPSSPLVLTTSRRIAPLPLLLIALLALGGPTTLVSNTGQSPSATANITQQYFMGFQLGVHGQGYEISSVSIDLAAAPSSLTVSLWTGGTPGSSAAGTSKAKLFDFENPDSFVVGLNEFTAPAGAFAFQNLNHWIVLSGFGSSLSINETTLTCLHRLYHSLS